MGKDCMDYLSLMGLKKPKTTNQKQTQTTMKKNQRTAQQQGHS